MPQSLSNMMTPVLALVVWTMVILVWLYLRRIPAMRKAGIDPAKIKGSESYASMPPLNPKAKSIWLGDDPSYSPKLDCAPCCERVCPLGHTRCMADVKPEQVLQSVQSL